MFFRLFKYFIESERGLIAPSSHLRIFRNSRATDENGRLAIYRNSEDAILMHVRGNEHRFCGKVGRYATEREVTRYDAGDDEANSEIEADNDIPHVAFLCSPELGMIACEDHPILAASAMNRLHAILNHRQKVLLNVAPIATASDLRLAANSFRLFKVTFDLERVNPHTGDLGKILDENNKRDNIKRVRGSIESDDKPLRLQGGTLEAVQQLHESGHARVGFEGFTKRGTLVSVKKSDVSDEETDVTEKPAVRVRFSDRPRYPFSQEFMDEMESIMRSFNGPRRAKS